MLKFLFVGRMSRVQYALMALPLLAVFTTHSTVFSYLSILLFKVDVFVQGMIVSIVSFTMIQSLICLLLLIASIKRLRDIGWVNWLGLPYLVPGLVSIDVTWSILTFSKRILDYPLVEYVMKSVIAYGLLLALVLLVVPGRRKLPVAASPAAVF